MIVIIIMVTIIMVRMKIANEESESHTPVNY